MLREALDRSRSPDNRHALPMMFRAALASGSDSRHEALAASARAGREWAGHRRNLSSVLPQATGAPMTAQYSSTLRWWTRSWRGGSGRGRLGTL